MSEPDLGLFTFKKKFIWKFTAQFPNGSVPETEITASRRKTVADPVIEDELNYLSAKTWIPGRAMWDKFTTTFRAVDEVRSKHLFDLLKGFYKDNKLAESVEGEAKGTVVLTMYTGMGNLLETWTFEGAYPIEVNFSDYGGPSELDDLEIMWEFAKVQYRFHRVEIQVHN